ncbi:hypothetical protein QF026_005877 [Streptomyces aurantiacus]|uniref:hypothetical protein n=1 Tax=Streptomyces aurantiacus TaxID=47760 RepID=UPI00279087D6|nr:hypothetical protein [Streptomyces aurantiacus]MDQ0777411.1 hypothetical protein [Streptomyces aurantiacus]
MMTGLRTALVAATAAVLLSVTGAVTTASADDDASVKAPGCAQLGAYGDGWANIHNICDHTISASVEVDWADPSCIQIGPRGVGRIGLEPGDDPYYAYEC